MIYITVILLAVSFIWIFVYNIKDVKSIIAIIKCPTDNRAVHTPNQDLLAAWVIISYLLLFLYLICYLFVFDSGEAAVITTEMIKRILWYAFLTIIMLPNLFFIIIFCFAFHSNRKAAVKVDIKADQKLMLATIAGYFIVAAVSSVCLKYKLISPLVWFTILTYGTIAGLGLIAKALKE